jgi:hypothetical protein
MYEIGQILGNRQWNFFNLNLKQSLFNDDKGSPIKE